ncbi:MAG TPA: outer membrane beta-barrel protein [Ohtaekwangia sp.]
MKKILFTLTCVTLVYMSYAQTVSGTKAIGGGINYTSESGLSGYEGDDGKQTDFSIMPTFGYFVSDNVMVGVAVGYLSSKSENLNFYDEETTGFVVGPLARYYVHTTNESFAFYGQFTALFISGKTSYDGVDDETKSGGLDISISPGFAYFLNEHWALELGFRGIAYTKEDPDKDADDDEQTTFTLGLNSFMPATIGFRYHF